MVKKVCIVTGSRSEYGVLKGLMNLIKNSDFLDLQVVVTGAHLSPEFGNTFELISKDGFFIDKKAINRAIKTAFSDEFQFALKSVKNVYGDGGAHKKILKYLESYSDTTAPVKKFYNIGGLI